MASGVPGARFAPALKHFFFSSRREPDVRAGQAWSSLAGLYLVALLALFAGPFNIVHDLRAGHAFLALMTLTFCLMALAAVIVFWSTRSLQAAQGMLAGAIAVLLIAVIVDGGGVRGFGFIYFIAAFPILQTALGIKGAIALTGLMVVGSIARLVFGVVEPGSIYHDADTVRRYIVLVLTAAGFGIPSMLIQHRLMQRLARAAYVDPTTGLANRTRLMEAARAMLSEAQRSDRSLGFIALKLKRFTQFNSRNGMAMGDAVLGEVARRIVSMAPEGALICRYSGTMFMVVGELGAPGEIERLAGRLTAEASRPFEQGIMRVALQMEAVVTRYPEDGHNLEKILSNILSTLAKPHRGPELVRYFNEASYREDQRRYALVDRLRRALENNEFRLVYHPKYWLKDERCAGAEVLLRWETEDFGAVAPADFIPLAEETGVIREISRWVLIQAHREVALIKEKFPDLFKSLVFAINLSPLDIADKRILDYLSELERGSGIDRANIEFEITEGTLMEDEPAAVEVLESLREHGYRLAIDDFGTGYSSLSYLHRLRVNTIKIDRSFVMQIDGSDNELPIVQAIISMASSLGLELVAEGVETKAQSDYLAEHNCQFAQGWLYSKPLPLEDYLQLLSSRCG
ncbi:MAG: GGDEF domain-containing protein [Spirochaetia bacterium]|nr:GGDEF domain-containing protein [Spirochaetia bacterium]